jgi:hypothetical protein
MLYTIMRYSIIRELYFLANAFPVSVHSSSSSSLLPDAPVFLQNVVQRYSKSAETRLYYIWFGKSMRHLARSTVSGSTKTANAYQLIIYCGPNALDPAQWSPAPKTDHGHLVLLT